MGWRGTKSGRAKRGGTQWSAEPISRAYPKRRPLKSAPNSFHQQRRILQISLEPTQRLDHTQVRGRCASATLGLGAATFAVGRLKSCHSWLLEVASAFPLLRDLVSPRANSIGPATLPQTDPDECATSGRTWAPAGESVALHRNATPWPNR